MSSRGPSLPALAVKKTRVPAPPRREGPKPLRVRRESPLGGAGSSASTNAPSSEALSQSSHASDMDSLTSGMKRIKINLTTKAQREAKDGSKAGIKAPKPPKSTKPKQSAPGELPNPESSASQVHSSVPSYVQEASQIPLPPSSPSGSTSITETVSADKPEPPSDVFIPYQPDGPPASTSAPAPESLRWLPPNTATPGTTPGATPIKKNELPVFTATSSIPFGVASTKEPHLDDSIWDVPETPRNI